MDETVDLLASIFKKSLNKEDKKYFSDFAKKINKSNIYYDNLTDIEKDFLKEMIKDNKFSSKLNDYIFIVLNKDLDNGFLKINVNKDLKLEKKYKNYQKNIFNEIFSENKNYDIKVLSSISLDDINKIDLDLLRKKNILFLNYLTCDQIQKLDDDMIKNIQPGEWDKIDFDYLKFFSSEKIKSISNLGKDKIDKLVIPDGKIKMKEKYKIKSDNLFYDFPEKIFVNTEIDYLNENISVIENYFKNMNVDKNEIKNIYQNHIHDLCILKSLLINNDLIIEYTVTFIEKFKQDLKKKFLNDFSYGIDYIVSYHVCCDIIISLCYNKLINLEMIPIYLINEDDRELLKKNKDNLLPSSNLYASLSEGDAILFNSWFLDKFSYFIEKNEMLFKIKKEIKKYK